MARTDAHSGVWKAPAGIDAALLGATGLTMALQDRHNAVLYDRQCNPVNCLRSFPGIGHVVWGARTFGTSDQWRLVPVRRLASFIEESLQQNLVWAVFEPNDEALWGAIRASVGAFMADLQKQGAFYNQFVTCDATTTTPDDIAAGRVNIVVGFAPVHPAEFVVLQIQQLSPPAG